ncbi:similar to Saccharomyces cerevisiae YOR107W RGS2 Negative regulator of glucose- induced cAMP signaling [Maudiozyma barnettii]|uniref:Similar to Saccharomyces cerevisiae YOR107W RGS2 Negative regulator of glucose- induced cAMP signaling n=1 Tax=Maudiozyma barnettii TaxID=61262 RepID=A0A8H2ZH68_9SACH|nr:GTPase-activating protein RGS2 [Kazachstania barnettii]CAB4254222.1 similar to Saccharomyces cerevisiae YOR107W RGS2 Negative regulator of glucose- induced cAMP signaling [Kazachstania barnettii]CAD1781956.1 similar to Saccharomyces cerevisiae YOR107W RGS2 Negative regulator of glucose- induced cAMP signaling [Kazachstania barnettii]
MPTVPNLYELLSELNESTDYTTDTISSRRSSSGSTSTCDPYSLHEFYKYLKKCHCDENLEFFNKTRRFLVSENTLSRNISTDNTYWNDEVYNKFIVVDSPAQCNFPQYVRDNFDACHSEGVRPTQAEIINAIEIVMGMLFDAYSRYLNHIQTNDHYSVVSEEIEEDENERNLVGQDDSATSQEYEDKSISKYGLDMEKLNKDIAHMTLTNSMSSLTTTENIHTVSNVNTHSRMTLNVKLPTPEESRQQQQVRTNKNNNDGRASLITKGKLFFHRLQKRHPYTTNSSDGSNKKTTVTTTSTSTTSNKMKKNGSSTSPKSLKKTRSNNTHSHKHTHSNNVHSRSAAASLTFDRPTIPASTS